MGNEQIRIAVFVIIAKCHTSRPSDVFVEPSSFCHIRESTISIVAVQNYTTETTHDQVGATIVVIVPDSDAHCPARITNACFVCHVSEGAIVFIMVQSAFGFLPRQRHRNTWCIREVDVEPAVAVIVMKSNTAAPAFYD